MPAKSGPLEGAPCAVQVGPGPVHTESLLDTSGARGGQHRQEVCGEGREVPLEVWGQVFGWLSPRERARMREVCAAWEQLVRHAGSWPELAPHEAFLGACCRGQSDAARWFASVFGLVRQPPSYRRLALLEMCGRGAPDAVWQFVREYHVDAADLRAGCCDAFRAVCARGLLDLAQRLAAAHGLTEADLRAARNAALPDVCDGMPLAAARLMAQWLVDAAPPTRDEWGRAFVAIGSRGRRSAVQWVLAALPESAWAAECGPPLLAGAPASPGAKALRKSIRPRQLEASASAQLGVASAAFTRLAALRRSGGVGRAARRPLRRGGLPCPRAGRARQRVHRPAARRRPRASSAAASSLRATATAASRCAPARFGLSESSAASQVTSGWALRRGFCAPGRNSRKSGQADAQPLRRKYAPYHWPGATAPRGAASPSQVSSCGNPATTRAAPYQSADSPRSGQDTARPFSFGPRM